MGPTWTMIVGTTFIWSRFVTVALTLAVQGLLLTFHNIINIIWDHVTYCGSKRNKFLQLDPENDALLGNNYNRGFGSIAGIVETDKSTQREIFYRQDRRETPQGGGNNLVLAAFWK